VARKQFRFETLWRVRHLIEDKLQRELGVIQAELNQALLKKERTTQSFADEHRQLAEDMQKGLPAQDAQLRRQHLDALTEQGMMNDLEIIDAKSRLEVKRQEVLEATRSRKVMDRLREKFQAQQTYEENREEDKELGETALNRFLRDDETTEAS